MNPVQQRQRTTQINRLDHEIKLLAEAFDAELKAVTEEYRAKVEWANGKARELVATEHDRQVKAATEEHDWAMQALTEQGTYFEGIIRILMGEQRSFVSMTLWKRLRWLFTGRING